MQWTQNQYMPPTLSITTKLPNMLITRSPFDSWSFVMLQSAKVGCNRRTTLALYYRLNKLFLFAVHIVIQQKLIGNAQCMRNVFGGPLICPVILAVTFHQGSRRGATAEASLPTRAVTEGQQQRHPFPPGFSPFPTIGSNKEERLKF